MFFENNSSRLPTWCNDGDSVKPPYCQIKGKYRMELPGYNTMDPYSHMNEKCPSLPPKYYRSLDCWYAVLPCFQVSSRYFVYLCTGSLEHSLWVLYVYHWMNSRFRRVIIQRLGNSWAGWVFITAMRFSISIYGYTISFLWYGYIVGILWELQIRIVEVKPKRQKNQRQQK